MILTTLTNWKLTGTWPYAPLLGNSMETGAPLRGVTPTIDASVPGSIYMDLLNAGLIEHPYKDMNSIKCEWVANRWWVYETSVHIPEEYRGRQVKMTFKGIDYRAHIYAGGRKLATHEGMYVPCTVDISEVAVYGGETPVRVVIEHAPDEMGQLGHTSYTHTQKARFAYKWDWCTRLVGMGLYDEVAVSVTGASEIAETQVRYHGEGQVEAGLRIVTKGAGAVTGRAELYCDGNRIAIGEGTPVAGGWVRLRLYVENPQLWYPHGYGAQPLYEIRFAALGDGAISDQKTEKIGLRTIEYLQNENADSASLRYIIKINGVKIYQKGVNMTPVDMMYGCAGRREYERFVRMCVEANINLIRVWGGGLIEKDAFYDVCDEYGVMVWQEFIQSSSGIDNIPSKKPEFLALAAATAKWAVRARRNHVSLTVWSGGNELTDEYGVPSTYEDMNIAMLKGIVDHNDPDRQMLPTSASGPLEFLDVSRPADCHDVHGNWKYNGTEAHYDIYNRSQSLFHSEFGNDGMGNPETIRDYISPEYLNDFSMDTNLMWRFHGDWWDTLGYRDGAIFGRMDSLEEFAAVSQFMQGEGIRYALEANRRRAWQNSGSILWHAREPWPNVSDTCIIDCHYKPKLAYYMLRDAFKPVHISLRYDKLIYQGGEVFSGEVYVHNDYASEPFNAAVEVLDSDKNVIAGYTMDGATAAERAVSVRKFKYEIGNPGSVFYVKCTLECGECKDENLYIFFVRASGEKFCDKAAAVEYFEKYIK